MSAFRPLPQSKPFASLPDADTPRPAENPAGHGTSTSGYATSFVGRLRELDLLRSRLIAAQRGNGGVIAISGEPGIGKSRLASEAASLARRQQFAVIRSRVIEGDWQPDYQSWIDVLSQAVEWLPHPLSLRHIPEWAPPLAPLVTPIMQRFPDAPAFRPGSANEERFRLCTAITKCLIEIARSQPLAIIVDDVQWSDANSLRVFQYLASAAGSTKLLIVLLIRSDQLMLNTTLGDALGRLQREEAFQDLRLRGLDRAMTGQLITELTHRPVSDAAVDLIYDATNGNPFFAMELARHLADEGLLAQIGAEAGIRQIADLAIHDGLRAVIERRLRRLTPHTQELLRLAAICGDSFDDADLLALSTATLGEVLDVIDNALAAQLIRPAPQSANRYRFVHQLIQHTLADGWAPSRRIRLHRQLADGLAVAFPPAAHARSAHIARHYLASAALPGAEAGIPFARDAAALARRAFQPEEAVAHLRLARDLAADIPPPIRADILATLTVAEADAFLLDDALRTAHATLDDLVAAGAPPGKRAAFIATAVTAMHDAGMPAEAWLPLLNEGLELTPPEDRHTWARLTLLIERFEIIVEGAINGSRWLGTDPDALAIARSGGDEELYARSLQPWDLWDRAWTEGLSRRIRTWHKPAAIIRALTVCSADWLYHQGDFRRAQAEFEDLLDLATRQSSIPGQAEAHVRLAIIHAALGNLAPAREFGALAQESVARLGAGHRLRASLWWVNALLAGDDPSTWRTIADYFVRYVADPDIARGTIALDDAALAALALVRAGDRAEAERLLHMLTAVLARVEPTLWLLNGTIAFAATAAWEMRLAAPAIVTALGETAQAIIVSGSGDFPCSSLHLTVARMATLLGDHAAADTAFAAARATLEASGQRPQRAMVDFDEAIACAEYRTHCADMATAYQLMAAAVARFRELGLEHWAVQGERRRTAWSAAPAGDTVNHVTATTHDLASLSPREIEVLRLVARGLSDRQISDQIFISLRTVHAHVRNMLAKTGTSNRTELSVWAIQRDLIDRT